MPAISTIMARGSALLTVREETATSMSTTIIDLLIALLVLVFVALCLVGALYTVRKIRRNRAVARQQLPLHNESRPISNHRRLTITATPYGRNSSVYIYDEKSAMIKNPSSPPLSPENVPEIRITFPDEQDESGKWRAGSVVIVRVGDTSVGLEPVNGEQLPAYEKETGEFQSIDMDTIGGLKEKESWS